MVKNGFVLTATFPVGLRRSLWSYFYYNPQNNTYASMIINTRKQNVLTFLIGLCGLQTFRFL